MNNSKRLVLLIESYHTSIEREFKNLGSFVSRRDCGHICLYCTGGSNDFAEEFSARKLKAALMSNMFDRGSVQAKKFDSFITDKNN